MTASVGHADLTWAGPFKITSVLCDRHYDVPGLYLWVETLPGEHRGQISYIGKAGGRPTLMGRHLDHFTATVGCRNQIPEWARATHERWECRPEREAVREVLCDKRKLLALAGEAFDYVTSFDIYLASLDGDLQIVERSLIWDLKPFDNTSGTKVPPPRPVSIVHRNAQWLTPTVERQARTRVTVA